MSPEDEDYFLPLEDQRVFGAGIRRKRVPFVRSSQHELNTTDATTTTATTTTTQAGPGIANKYLSIVLPKNEQCAPAETETTPAPAPTPAPEAQTTTYCEVCNLPLLPSSSSTTTTHTDTDTDTDNNTTTRTNRPHEASLAHQVCLTHSHPPSYLDRTRHGLRYLSSYGWDPDSRVGLGVPGREGIREPVKGRIKADTVGLGVKHGDDDEDVSSGNMKRRRERKRREMAKNDRGRVQKNLNAKEVRIGDLETRKKGDKLREMFYQSEDVQKYLG